MAPVLYRFGPLLLLFVQSISQHLPDICNVSRCKHGGTCISYGDMYMCKCAPGYAGVMCEIDTDPCSPNPCKNSGKCTVGLTKEDTFVCECQAGYSGRTCDLSPCDKVCSMIYSPVCGSDMFTYISECQLQRTVCNKPWLKAIDDKPCKSVGCKTLCAPTPKPVCGTDCVTYTNECELDNERRCEAQKYQTQLTKSYNGDCRAFSCDIRRPYKCSKCLLLTGRVCGSDGKRYKSECHLLIKACSNPGLKKVDCKRKGNCTIPTDLNNVVARGRYPGDTVPVGTRLVFFCKSGYTMKGNAEVKCKLGKRIKPPKCYENCNDITRFENGAFNGQSTHGEEIFFSCNTGYSLVGASKIKCINGDYSSVIPSCKAKCARIDSISNGQVTESSNSGQSYQFTCDKGHTLIGAGNITCTDGGIYTSSIPECKADCIPMKPLQQGQIIPGTTHGQETVFYCLAGYTLEGVNKTRCVDGKYKDPKPTCRANCPEPVPPNNGIATGDSYHGGTVTYTCFPGYTIDGVNSTVCADGKYQNSPPICRSLCNEADKPNNGYYDGSFENGSTISIKCYAGYSLVGDGIIACIAGRLNSSLDLCKADCIFPGRPLNGDVSGDVSGDLVHGGQITYTCNEGYTLVGGNTATCINGNFQGTEPVCRENCDTSTSIPYGTYTGSLIHGGSIRVTCDLEYTLVGSRKIRCMDGQFTSSLNICKAPCNSIYLENGIVKGTFSHGGDIYFNCVTDYKLEGVAVTTCVDGKLRDELPTCHASCNSVNLQNGRVTGDFTHGGNIFFSCTADYKRTGVAVTTCRDGSLRDPLPTCHASCSSITISNGDVTGDLTHGGQMVFSCDSGYEIDGVPRTTCVDGSSQASLPTCRKLCSSVSLPNGSVTGDYTHGRQVTFSCDFGFTLDGVSSTTCENGQLADQTPFCRANCDELSAPSNGTILFSNNVNGGVTTFQCLKGFTLVGGNELRCNDGAYDKEPPKCAGDCPEAIPPANGLIRESNTTHGGLTIFECNKDYSIDGDKKTYCIDGQYNHEAPVCRKKCPRQRNFNGQLGGSRAHGGITQFSCTPGFTLVGVNMTVCLNGEYQDDQPVCKEDCQPPADIEHGTYTGEYTHGSVITYTCSNGHSLTGDAQRNCSDGDYTGSDPECNANCVEITDFPNGIVTGQPVHNEFLTFACDNDYTLEGPVQIRCQDGAYSDPFPQCMESAKRSMLRYESCKKLTLENGKVSGDFTHKSNVYFSCNDNYSMVGPKAITCLEGIYASEAPTCYRNCEDPGTPLDGRQTTVDFTHGGKVRFDCSTDFTLDGSETIVCEDGRWNNPIPSCSPCTDGETFYNGTCFSQYFETLEIVTAKESCKQKGGHLATYTTQEELFHISANTNVNFAIGLEQEAGNDWTHVTNEPVDFVNWAPNNCVYLSQIRDYRWSNSIQCTENMLFICEYKYVRDIPAACVYDSVNYLGHSYTVKGFNEGERKLSWREARDACAQDSGQLVVIDNHSEQKAINTFLGNCGPYESDNFWVGLIRENINSQWGWIDNSELTFNFWPDFQCAYMGDKETRYWFTAPCDNQRVSYICERGGTVSPRLLNPCKNNPCQFGGTCVPKVTEDFSDYYCICTTGRGGPNCQDTKKCPDGLICGDGSCVQLIFKCDTVQNCPDGSDEICRGDFG
ncbi:sushi, von Willebrand factor type A, EGF and pentraxin domain-containing protein 1-like isoform X2 [Antedon mediterranea]|uniref:sushi, von Willebrand factor type A, EGF and pentraxin domain-containing protein 1-like isoform X2 n=1 Tax=Antedon mediterranea TaxID=105859 RepID=UPI003AF65077